MSKPAPKPKPAPTPVPVTDAEPKPRPRPKLSVVVPFHDVEQYVEECLESLAVQSLRDLEVIMVDDGSSDNSAVLAKAFAERDPRFVLVQQDSQGLGPARNTGVRHATGEYLAFVDSDDVVARNAYALLVASLDRTGSDLACGNVCRFDSRRTWQSPLHADPFESSRSRTHIRRQPALMRDRTAWNKVFRRSFWDEHDFAFPDALYEDGPVAVRAHILARAVDVHREHVYFWRQRPGSITADRNRLTNIEARLAMLGGVQEFLADQAPELLTVWNEHALDVDLPLLVDALVEADDTDREKILALGQDFLRKVGTANRGGRPALSRLKHHLVERGMLDRLIELHAFERSGEAKQATVSRRGVLRTRWYADYPFRDDEAIPEELYDVTDELGLVARVDTTTWTGGRLLIEGHAFVRRIDLPDLDSAEIKVWLRSSRRSRRTLRNRIELVVTRVRRPDVTASYSGGCYDWSGFVLDLDPEALARFGARTGTTWFLEVEVTAQGLSRRGFLANPRQGRERWQRSRTFDETMRARPVATPEDRFVVRIAPVLAEVTGWREVDEELEITGWSSAELGADATLVVARRYGSTKRSHPVRRHGTRNGRTSFTAAVPLDGLTTAPEAAEATPGKVIPLARFSDGVDWDISLIPASGVPPQKLAMPDGVEESRLAVGSREVAVTRTVYGNLRLVERTCRPVVRHVEWLPADVIAITGELAGATVLPDTFVLRSRTDLCEHRVPVTWKGSRFRATVPVAALPLFGRDLPLGPGSWEVLATVNGVEVPVIVERGVIPDLRGETRVGCHEVMLDVRSMERLVIRVRTGLEPEERTALNQPSLLTAAYARHRESRIEKLAVFSSFRGRQFSDSPRAIHEEIVRRGVDLDCVWVVSDGRVPVDSGIPTVLAGSAEHLRALARARYVIGNDHQPEWFVKRAGQTCLQTWHGTPLKRVGFDIECPPLANATDYLRRFADDVAKWDVLISPNPFSTEIMRRAFRYEGEVLETGYPRNDLLCRAIKGSAKGKGKGNGLAAQIRARLGVPGDKRIVLYAPTWRDDEQDRSRLELDLDVLRQAIGKDHVLLVRSHVNVGRGFLARPDGFTLDVTKYPEMAELLAVADVLVTDYSSVMFDFAVTGRPMLFYTYDLAHHRDHMGGFYFDFEQEAPGPILATSGEVADALRDLVTATKPHQDAYKAFVERFCPLDDGSAAARVVDRLLEL